MEFSQMSGSYWNGLCSLDCVDRGKLVDPFYQLEHMGEDVAKAKKEAPLLVRLQQSSDLKHSDNYARNKALRADLRVCLYCYPSQLLCWSSLESECGVEYFSYHLWEREGFNTQMGLISILICIPCNRLKKNEWLRRKRRQGRRVWESGCFHLPKMISLKLQMSHLPTSLI